MDLAEVVVHLDNPLKVGDPGCLWDLVRVRDKAIQQMKFLLEMTEKLSCSTFSTLSETETGDIGSQSYNFMLCNI